MRCKQYFPIFLFLLLSLLLAPGSHRAAAQENGLEQENPHSIASENNTFYLDPVRDYSEGEIEPYYVRYTPGGKNAMAQAARALGGEVVYDLDIVDTLAINMPPQAIQGLANNPHLVFYEPIPEHSLLEVAPDYPMINSAPASDDRIEVVPWNIDQFQARDIWDQNRDGIVDPGAPTGEGIKFCIIDSGIYGGHEDFNWDNITGFSQISGESWDEDENGHGTHVAGTANALQNGIGVVGVAPGGMELHIVKVFNNNGQWVTGQSNLGAAAQECRDAGANVLSMSLGGGFSSTENSIFQALYDDDNILNIAAAGNSGNSSRSYPASYMSVISVGAIDSNEVAASFTQYPDTDYDPDDPPPNVEWDVVELAGGGVAVLSTMPGPPGHSHGDIPLFAVITQDPATYDAGVYHIEEAALGSVEAELVGGGLCDDDDIDPAWNNRIVLCERGSISFANKVNNVRNNGGLGAIIFNNEPGEFLGTCGGDCQQPSIPAVSMTQADGQYLQANNLNETVQLIADDGSDCSTCFGSYNYMSGTSMATPGVAAAVGFTWAACGGGDNINITNKDIRQLLRDTAKDLEGQHPDGPSYGEGWDPVTGWGLVQLKDALDLGTERFGATNCPPVGVVQADPLEQNVCTMDNAAADFNVTIQRGDFEGNYVMSAADIPAGANSSFDPNPVLYPGDTTTLTITDLPDAAAGSHTITIIATDQSDPDNKGQGSAFLNLAHDLASGHGPLSPVNGSAVVSLTPTFDWSAADVAESYILEVATDHTFTDLVINETVAGTSYTPATALDPDTYYYWRVTAVNACGLAQADPSVFRTPACSVYNGSTGTISGGATVNFTAESTLAGTVNKINVLNVTGSHDTNSSYLDIRLIKDGIEVALKPEGQCTISPFGPVTFDQSSTNAFDCSLSGIMQPTGNLDDFAGVEADGTWTLQVYNSRTGGSPFERNGAINSWAAEICVEAAETIGRYGGLPVSYGLAWHAGDAAPHLGAEAGAQTEGYEEQTNTNREGVLTHNAAWVSGEEVSLDVTVNGTGWLAMWVDWNGNGNFDDAGERVVSQAVEDGDNTVTFDVPTEYETGTPLNVRVRLYDSLVEPDMMGLMNNQILSGPQPSGEAVGGDIADFTIEFTPTAISLAAIGVNTPLPTSLLALLALAVAGMTAALLLARRPA